MCKIGDLILTPWHVTLNPLSNVWEFPNEFPDVENIQMTLDHVINLVLQNGHYVIIQGFKCVTMGHNLTSFDSSNINLYHPFFGTSSIIQCLNKFKSSPDDVIIYLDKYKVIRDVDTGMTSDIIKVD
jgi:hypothetical protein